MPLMNCLAKIPFYILIVGIFFMPQQAPVRIVRRVRVQLFRRPACGETFSRFLVKGETAPFVEIAGSHLHGQQRYSPDN